MFIPQWSSSSSLVLGNNLGLSDETREERLML